MKIRANEADNNTTTKTTKVEVPISETNQWVSGNSDQRAIRIFIITFNQL